MSLKLRPTEEKQGLARHGLSFCSRRIPSTLQQLLPLLRFHLSRPLPQHRLRTIKTRISVELVLAKDQFRHFGHLRQLLKMGLYESCTRQLLLALQLVLVGANISIDGDGAELWQLSNQVFYPVPVIEELASGMTGLVVEVVCYRTRVAEKDEVDFQMV